MASGSKTPKAAKSKPARNYRHTESESLMRPEVGTQAQFKKKKEPKKYRYDDSLSPALDWDGQNPARERGEARIARAEHELVEAKKKLGASAKPEQIEEAKAHLTAAQEAVRELTAMSKPFLNWAGKAEHLSFDVPTLPLFIHERLSTTAILETLKGHRRDKQIDMFDLYGDPRRSITDQVMRAYEYPDKWVNRMILGDSLVVMNSLLQYESLGGHVQMIYMDPPYGVEFKSNFQPFVRSRNVKHNQDEDLTREPEMVQAYRDTWELRVHSYLTYLRDRLLLCHQLLSPTGGIFVQISDENLAYLRLVLDEVFGAEHFVVTIPVKKKGGQKSSLLDPVNDYLLWYAKDIDRAPERFSQLYDKVQLDSETIKTFRYVELPDGRELTATELSKEKGFDYTSEPQRILTDFPSARIFKSENITGGKPGKSQAVLYKFRGRVFDPGIKRGLGWKHSAISDDAKPSGMDRLAAAGRLCVGEDQLGFKRYLTDFGYQALSNWWDGLGGAPDPIYVVQTNEEIVKRCILMTTRPGDLVLDPTCGSGTTAYVAEQWGRRWITTDCSRVPLSLARQRVLTATYPWYDLQDDSRGPAAGFRYKHKQSRKGEELGGIVPHITSTSIANDEPPEEEVLVDRPEETPSITRVTGPFCVEATIPTPKDWGESVTAEAPEKEAEKSATFVDRMLEVLRRSPLLRLEGNKTVTLKNVRPPAKTLSLSAEAIVDATALGNGATLADAVQEAKEQNGMVLPLSQKPVAIVFGPENGAVSEKLVYEAAREAHGKGYARLFVIGFGIQPNARLLVERCMDVVGIPASYIQATPDLVMGELLKNMRSSQIFSVCGLPEIELRKVKPKEKTNGHMYEVELLGLDVFDPVEMENHKRKGDDVPAWFLDTDYNGLCFHVSQAFFPRTAAWESLKKALRAEYEETVWDHLAGTVSAPFEAGEHGQIAVKVIDDRGNELMVVRAMREAK